MSGWEESLTSREPSPEEVAMGAEEASRVGPPPETGGLGEEEKRLLHEIFRDLLKREPACYIALREFLRRQGDIAPGEGTPAPKPYWGYYSEMAERWRCSPHTVKKWLLRAFRFVVDEGRRRAGTDGPRGGRP